MKCFKHRMINIKFGENHIAIADTLFGLASYFYELGNIEDSEQLLSKINESLS